MPLTTLPHRRTGLIALALASVVALSTLVSTESATALQPAGSRAEVMLETEDATLKGTNAITSGWWGHETVTGTGSTFLSMNAANSGGVVNDASIAALNAQMGTDDLSNIYYAIVPSTADGSNEAPAVSPGENAAEAFKWTMNANLGTALSGNTNANDSVVVVSTLSQITAWVGAGQPVQGFDNSLALHDVLSPGNPVSTAPMGTSILNTWPAGTRLSLVAYVAAGNDHDLNDYVPIVKRGSDGKAQTAWLPFTTVASPTSTLRTSAGYQVAGPAKPTLTMTDSYAGSSGTVKATVRGLSGAVATDATGSMQFAPVVSGSAGTPISVPVSNGVASLSFTLAPGTSRQYDVRYVPDGAAAATYLPSDIKRYTTINKATTTTSLTISGSGTYVLAAMVAPAGAGSMSFTDGATSIGQASVSGGVAKVSSALAPGRHTLAAAFNPSDAAYLSSTSPALSVWVPRATTKLSPAKPRAGTRPKLTVTLAAPGTTVAGKAKITIDPPKGKTKTVTVVVRAGKARVKLPKSVRGKTVITIAYLGSGHVLAVSKTFSFAAK